MENLLNSNLYSLCNSTNANEKLLIFLIEKGIIPEELKEEIDNSSSSFKKASLLYSYFKKSRKESDLDLIIEGLQLSGNVKAVQILTPGSSKDRFATQTIGVNDSILSSSSSTSKNSKRARMDFDASVAPKFKTIGNEKIDWPINHGLTLPVDNFVGRNQELKELESFLLDNKKLVLICGFGGLGKTELCRKFLQTISKQNLSIIWLHGDTFESLKSSVFSLASKLNVVNDSASPSETFEYLTEMTLKHSSRLVVVIDNVDSKFEEVSKVVRIFRKYENVLIIVTSRNKLILNNAGQTMLLDVLSKQDARIILRKCIENISDSDADSLSELVEYYPLALQQAIAYIKEQREDFLSPNYSVSDYVKEYEEKKLEMLDQRLNNFEHDYAMTTLVTWEITFDKLSPEAIEFLKILAFLDPDYISVDFSQEICVELGYKDKFKEAVNSLKMYSLIKVENLVISIHRLVQDVMREKVEKEFSKKMFNAVVFSYAKRRCELEDDGESELEDDDGESHLRRIVWLVYGIGSLIIMSRHNFLGNKSPNAILVDIKSEIALKLSRVNNDSDCLELCEQVLASTNSEHNSAHENAFRALIILSKNNSNLLVVQLLENSLESKKSTLGDNHKITTQIKIVLATVLENRQSQLELFSEIRNCSDFNNPFCSFYTELILTLIIGEDWVTRDDIYRYASRSIYLLFDFEVLEKLLPFYKKVLDENDELTVKVKNAVASKIYDNESAKSLELLEQVISSNIQTEVKSAYWTMDSIANSFYAKGNYKEAKPLFERVYKYYKVHMPEHIANETKLKLVLTLVKLGYGLNKAINLHSEPLDSTDGIHRNVCFMNEVAFKFYYDAEYTKALELLEQVISSNIQTQVVKAYETMSRIAGCFYGDGNYNKAKALFERLLKFYQDHDEAERAIETKCWLVFTLVKLGCDLNESIDLYYEPIHNTKRKHGKVCLINHVARKFLDEKEYARSLELIEQVISSNIEDEVEAAYSTMNSIADSFYDDGNYNEAKPLFERVLKYNNNSCIVSVKILNDAKYNLAKTIFKLGCDLAYARNLCHESLSYYEAEARKQGEKQKYSLTVILIHDPKREIQKIKSLLTKIEKKILKNTIVNK